MASIGELDSAVVVRPGDTLVVGISRMITQADAHAIKERLAEKLPGVEAVIIDTCSSLAAYRPDPDGHPPGCKCAACY